MLLKVIKIELSIIYITAALLVAAIGGLVGKVVLTGNSEPYPSLYVNKVQDFVKPALPTVYFTFDDGPSPNTEKILNVLKRQKVAATFFVTAQNFDEPYAVPLLNRMVDEGHTIGLHSYSHRGDKIYRSVDAYLTDIEKLNDRLYDILGIHPNILRFAGGSATVNAKPSVMVEIIQELTRRGYQYYDWDVVSGDDSTTVYDAAYLSERMVNGVLKSGKDSVIILLHDNPTPVTTFEAVDRTINQLREKGYAFDKLTEKVEPVHIKTTRFSLDES